MTVLPNKRRPSRPFWGQRRRKTRPKNGILETPTKEGGARETDSTEGSLGAGIWREPGKGRDQGTKALKRGNRRKEFLEG